MATVIPDYRLQIQHDGKWLTIAFAQMKWALNPHILFEKRKGRQYRIQKLRENSARKIYDTI